MWPAKLGKIDDYNLSIDYVRDWFIGCRLVDVKLRFVTDYVALSLKNGGIFSVYRCRFHETYTRIHTLHAV
jgi:hypothetical protein